MQVEEIKLHKVNKLIADYKSGKEIINEKFDYQPFKQKSYIQKAEEIKKQSYKREELAEILTEINKDWGAPEAVMANISRLRNPESVVVIAGQQAGLLTGPAYTVHKIISVLQIAKKQERELNVPVIPVFWIAGEDHDFDEINHVFLAEKDRMKKHTVNQYHFDKKPVSEIEMDKDAASDWLGSVFKVLEETEHTKRLFHDMKEILDRSSTYVDFFASLVLDLFGDTGLVLLDSGSSSLRQLECDYFKEMIRNQPQISKGVYKQIQQNMQQGYSSILDVDQNDAHLFYHLNGERILLTKEAEGVWSGKQGEVSFSEGEMIELAENHPEKLSNNVVTRPVMQELLFPCLAFVGGPGEIAYWSVLKPAFRALGCKMPIVLPRASFTVIDRTAAKHISALTLNASAGVNFGFSMEKGNWLASQQNPPIETMAEEVKSSIERAHMPLRHAAKSMRADLGELADKNLFYLNQDIDFLKDRLVNALKEKHENQLAVFDQLELVLHPFQGLQERTWNILPWLNEYGSGFLHQLTEKELSEEADHFLVYL